MTASAPTISPLRQCLLDEMRMRMRKLEADTQRSPDTASVEDLRNFQLHLVDTATLP